MSGVVTIARNDFALLRRDPLPATLLVVMPLVVMAFMRPAFRPVLQAEGYPVANGAEQVVPGITVMFAVFVVTFAGVGFFRDHIWGTWDRILSAPLPGRTIMLGKLTPALTLILLQQLLLFGAGTLFFDLHVRGSVAGLALVDLAFAAWLLAFSFASVAYSKTFQQLLAISNVGAIVLAGLGGALTPLKTLPSWAQTISPATPTHWAMTGFNRVILHGRAFSSAVVPALVLLGFAALFAVLGALRFRLDEPKGGTL